MNDDKYMFRMPASFGPSPGPRQDPTGKPWGARSSGAKQQTALRITVETDAGALTEIMPPSFELVGIPRLILTASYLEDIGWLAGRGYNICSVDVPAAAKGVEGVATLVAWESLTDPIITGREELGIAKLYAEIPPLEDNGESAVSRASWLGFEFLQMQLTDLRSRQAPGVLMTTPTLNHKYITKTGAWDQSDADYVTVTPSRPMEIVDHRTGTADFEFRGSRWEDLPTLHHIVSRLRSLQVIGVPRGSISVTRLDFDGRDQHILA
jgi:hypothetical protein